MQCEMCDKDITEKDLSFYDWRVLPWNFKDIICPECLEEYY
mgnify:FL=1|jgi:hypothetical protein